MYGRPYIDGGQGTGIALWSSQAVSQAGLRLLYEYISLLLTPTPKLLK